MQKAEPAVLIVDDVEANLVTLEGLLEGMGCELIRARGGNEALRQLLRREFALMLLDVQMPEMDGYEVARYARENPATRDVPIIFLTAAHDSGGENVLRGYGTGAVDFLLKPLDAYVLRAKVRVFLDLYVSRQKLSDEIAAHRKTLRALESANTALRHFAQAASHDLKAPLRAIRGFLEALSSGARESLDPQARDYLDRSRRASLRMDSLLNALRTYAGLQRPVSYTEVDCRDVLEHVMSDLADRAAAADASVVIGDLPKVTGDPDRLYQLFLNLVANALKFQVKGEPARVSVSAEERGREWLVCVQDNGIGIEPKYHGTIFDAFGRLHEESKYEGTGLGLAISQQVAQQHGGRLWVESELGKGSRFYVTLPRA
jgi:signal transduction histidine kinase